MKLAVLHSPLDDTPIDRAELDPRFSPARYLPEHDWRTFVIGKSTAVRQTREAALGDYDAIVNMCDGGWDEELPGPEVVATLERFGAAFTGASSAFLDPPRDLMKLAAHAAGVRVPSYLVLAEPDEVDRALATLRFPLIVKPPHGYSSVGILPESKVADVDALAVQVRRALAEHGLALVEEFVEGRELTVLVAESETDGGRPRVYPPVEFLFPPGDSFKHHHLKWVDHQRMRAVPVFDDALAERVVQAAVGVFEHLDGDGYARCDLRVGEDGEPAFLEINPNCGVFYPEDEYGSADFILTLAPGGHSAFLEHLIDAAIRRRRRNQRRWRLSHSHARGFALEADRPIEPGTVIERFDGPPAEVVTLGRGTRPENWRPIRHGPDPNCRIEGRNLVAQRPIGAGEALTLDHAEVPGAVTVGPWPDAQPVTAEAAEPRVRRMRKRRRT